LSEDQAGLVFERFYRADTSRARDHGGGAGLGLAIVWSLVTAHDGTIELDTAPGEGATFRLRLPATA
jgi:two-component system OmpR family sensor kinase